MYMLDTNICIYLIKSVNEALARKISDMPKENVFISSIVVSELEYGVAKSQNIAKNTLALQQFMSVMNVLDYPAAAAREYGIIRADLERRGCVISLFDMMIAAHAKSCHYTLVTNNVKEFNRIDGLLFENWS